MRDSLGDNRGASRDSRHLGFIPDSLILSRAMVVYWRNGRPILHHPL
ncbi:S26 family signal peptidase [Gemmatimonas sp.]